MFFRIKSKHVTPDGMGDIKEVGAWTVGLGKCQNVLSPSVRLSEFAECLPHINCLKYAAVNYAWEMYKISINWNSPTTNCWVDCWASYRFVFPAIQLESSKSSLVRSFLVIFLSFWWLVATHLEM